MNDAASKQVVNNTPSGFPLWPLILVFAVAGALVAAAMMCIAWDHNSQGEIHDETGAHWRDWFFLGSTWFIAVGIVPSVLASLTLCVPRFVRRK